MTIYYEEIERLQTFTEIMGNFERKSLGQCLFNFEIQTFLRNLSNIRIRYF